MNLAMSSSRSMRRVPIFLILLSSFEKFDWLQNLENGPITLQILLQSQVLYESLSVLSRLVPGFLYLNTLLIR